MFAQMSISFDNFLSTQQCVFRKGHSTQHCLLVLLEKWKCAVDRAKTFCALLTDLSKVFGCLNHELLIVKPKAYGFSLLELKLACNYLSHRKQRTKVNNSYSTWLEIFFGVPEGSILGPLLFNIFLVDLFSFYVVADDINGVIVSLEKSSKDLFDWFKNNLFRKSCRYISSISQF